MPRAFRLLVSFQNLPDSAVAARTEPAPVLESELSEVSAPAVSVPERGALIAGTYRATEVIGGGGMGVVYLATDVRLGRLVALKLIREQLSSPPFRARFLDEARAMARVNHPNVVTIYAFGEHADTPYLAMELVSGKALDRLIQEHAGAVNLDLALSLLEQACLGLSAIHEAGTVHRDIKPSNLLVDQHARLRIGDLGLATSYQSGSVPREVVGTPGYIAPEILLELGDATPQSDVYSLACVAYEVLTGQPPFDPALVANLGVEHLLHRIVPPSEVRPGLPAAFDGVILAALAEDPRRRTGSAERFRRALLDARSAIFEPTNILLVDDDEDQRAVLQSALEAKFPTAQIDCAADGDAALLACARRPPCVVVSDLQMPGTDGIALTAALRARSDAQGIAIVLLTASGSPADWRLLSTLGADGFVIKPANLEDLASTIRRALRERRTLSQA
jgi:serine/threonine-protein kinase